MAKNTAVFGIYSSKSMVSDAVDSFRAAGFRNTDISALYAENEGTKDFAHEKNSKAPEGAIAGAVFGAILGGALGWLAGTGVLTIPALDPFLAAGPVIIALAGLGAVGFVGAIVGALIGMGMPEYEARRYQGRIRQGGILFSIHCDDSAWVKRAKKILATTGADGIASSAEAHADYAATDRPMPRGAATTT
jgi:hypothetical protein